MLPVAGWGHHFDELLNKNVNCSLTVFYGLGYKQVIHTCDTTV